MNRRFFLYLLTVITVIFAFLLLNCQTILKKRDRSSRFHYAQAEKAFYQHNIQESIDQLQKVVKTSSNSAKAYRKLANLHFYFQRAHAKAIAEGEKSIRLNPTNAENFFVLGKIYEGQQQYDQAIVYYERALELNSAFPYRHFYHLAKCQLALQDTNQAVLTLKRGIEFEANYSPTNRLLHKILVKRGNYQEAFDNWRIDNFVVSEHEAFGNFEGWQKNLRQAIRAVEDDPKDTDACLQLAIAYFNALLFEESRMVLEQLIRKNSLLSVVNRRWEIVNSYLQLMDEAKTIADAHYMRVINHQGNDRKFKQELWQAFYKMTRYYPELGPAPIRFEESYFQKLRDKIGETFQSVIIVGITDGVLDCHFGHIIAQEKRTITLWNKKAPITAIYLDYMVSNGYASWAWQYQTQHGGFSSSENIYTVYHIREPFLNRVVKDWWLSEDFISRENYKQNAQKERSHISRKPLDVFYSQQLQQHLRLKGLSAISTRLENQFLGRVERHSYFLKYVFDNIVEASIFYHEGQHAIDRIHSGIKNGGLKEMRSKLCEIHYGEMPFLTLSEIMAPDIGSDSYHGWANEMVFERIVSYIYTNSNEFPEIDTGENIMEQLHKLDKEQLQAIASYIFRSIDSKL